MRAAKSPPTSISCRLELFVTSHGGHSSDQKEMQHGVTGEEEERWMFTWYILKDAATGMITIFYLNYQEICYGTEDQFWFRIGAVTRNMAHVTHEFDETQITGCLD